MSERRASKEGFGEAELGDAQSSDPPADSEMIDGEREPTDDQDAGPTAAPEEIEADDERDQAEG